MNFLLAACSQKSDWTFQHKALVMEPLLANMGQFHSAAPSSGGTAGPRGAQQAASSSSTSPVTGVKPLVVLIPSETRWLGKVSSPGARGCVCWEVRGCWKWKEKHPGGASPKSDSTHMVVQGWDKSIHIYRSWKTTTSPKIPILTAKYTMIPINGSKGVLWKDTGAKYWYHNYLNVVLSDLQVCCGMLVFNQSFRCYHLLKTKW